MLSKKELIKENTENICSSKLAQTILILEFNISLSIPQNYFLPHSFLLSSNREVNEILTIAVPELEIQEPNHMVNSWTTQLQIFEW